ncbi:MAG: RNA-binding protein [Candidatus Daviesbacteria bacterium]|nr:RNA-binding protein [Candidatus Daviesbacteria bacterium]
MTKIFVGSLPYSTTSQELQEMFEKFGQVVSATVVMDKFTGQSRGFGFVEMQNDDEANKAIQDLNGSDMNGRALAVSVARPREERPQGDNFRRDNGGYQNRGGNGGGYDKRGGGRR